MNAMILVTAAVAIGIDFGQCVRNFACELTGDRTPARKPALIQSKSVYRDGGVIDVTYAGMPPLGGNWITIVPAGQEDNSWCSWEWTPGPGGTQRYEGLPKGTYEVRAYANWIGGKGAGGGQCEVIARKTFRIQ